MDSFDVDTLTKIHFEKDDNKKWLNCKCLRIATKKRSTELFNESATDEKKTADINGNNNKSIECLDGKHHKKMDIQYNDDGDGRHSHNSQNESIILDLLTLTLQITLIQKSSTQLRLNP